MKKCFFGLAVVLLSLAVFGVGHAQVDFHGVLNPNTHSVSIDTVILILSPTPETIPTPGWSSDSVAHDTFDFPDLLVWPLMVELRGRVDTLHTQQIFPGIENGAWYSFTLTPPPPPKVMFYGEVSIEEVRTGVGTRARLSVTPSVLVDKVIIEAQAAGASRFRLEIVDAAGNTVRSLGTHAGREIVTDVWHGDDDGGQMLPEGIYFCRLAIGEAAVVRKVLLTR